MRHTCFIAVTRPGYLMEIGTRQTSVNVKLRPLEGFRVGITADRRADEQAELLERRGASVVRGPAISTDYLDSDAALRAATDVVLATRPAFLVATTGIGMRAWFEAAQSWGLDTQLNDALRDTEIFARGPKATASVRNVGLEVAETAANERLDHLLAQLTDRELQGVHVAFQHYGEEDKRASDLLRAAGATVIDLPVYRWRLPDDHTAAARLVEAACDGEIDAITFTSAPAVVNLFQVAASRDRDAELRDAFNHKGMIAACVGPVCAAAAERLGIDGAIAPSVGRLGLLVRTLDDVLQERRVTLRSTDAVVVVQGRAVAVNGDLVELTPRERAVLDALVRRAGVVVSKATLLRDVWSGRADLHAVEATVGRLRRHLGSGGAMVRSVRGRGYLLDAEVFASS